MINRAPGLGRLKAWARQLRVDCVAVSRAARDPRTPRIARVLALIVVAYAASPIDLIPDFIALVLRWIPPSVIAEHRSAAAAELHVAPSRLGLAIVVGIWVISLIALTIWMKSRL
jgi:uncharacterized membrane protein YkvA (DUF1232 family)